MSYSHWSKGCNDLILQLCNAQRYEDVLVLSLGTGKTAVSYTAKKTARWGTLSWIFNKGNVPLLDMLMLASQDVVDYTLSNTFYEQGSHDNYLRIQVITNT